MLMADNAQNKKLIGGRLRWAREQAGLSQGQVAQKLSVHRPTISQIESGERNVRIEEMQQLAELYGVDENWLVKGDEALEGQRDPRIELAARELSKLKREDLDSILRLIQVLRSDGRKK
jgi:transcriptional regulator with XRE-family HTH domain